MNNNYIFESKEILGQSLIHGINFILPKNSIVVEIGTWYAQTACLIAQKCKNVSMVYTVDPYKAYFNSMSNIDIDEKQLDIAKNMAKHNIKYSGCSEKIRLIEKTSVDFSKEIKNSSIDMVFLDSEIDEQSALEDMDVWYPKLKNGGIFSGHHFGQIENIVNSFKSNTKNTNYLSVNDGVWAWIK